MQMRDARKIFLAGLFCAASAMAGGNAPVVSETGTVSAIKMGDTKDATQVLTRSDIGAAHLQQRKVNEPLFQRKKKTAQTTTRMLDEKQLGLGCAKP